MYKYHLENGTGMPLRYACSTTIAGVGVQYAGIIAPSSPVIRNKHGTNPSFTSPFLQGLSVGHIGLIPTRLLLFGAIFLALWALILIPPVLFFARGRRRKRSKLAAHQEAP